ncbi:MAG TPA: glucosamine-6-phosphate deaminase [Atribacteraceae bacterium]|nr:glucosamine-6-phosphate deaminase [Atribacteraceae bacterium]
MRHETWETSTAAACAAAEKGAQAIRHAIHLRGEANIVLATGMSQIEMLGFLTAEKDIQWNKVTAFHLDEYVGIPRTHRASFCKYLEEHFVNRVSNLRAFHYIDGVCNNPVEECRRLSELIASHPIDVCFVGIGENSHLAFNDPPADFETAVPYIVVDLDDDCKRQQINEGWFPTLEAVPPQAISMSVRQILASQTIVATVPDQRKAPAVKAVIQGPVTNRVPASILKEHADCTIFLDAESASLLI